MIEELIQNRRSIRRFKNIKVEKEILEKVVNSGRLYPSRGNRQPLKYILVDDDTLCDKIFENILWGSKVAGYKVFSDKTYCPRAYVLVLIDKSIMSMGYEYEMGAAIENILLTATENKLGSVWIKSANMSKIKEILKIEEDFIEIDSLVALGYPAHNSNTVEMKQDEFSVEIDSEMNLKVPKRTERNIIFYNKYGE